ncbi:MAG: MFS transporter [Clostridia bacterium]|nr:MFS transporter [Clostridia bacterium]
MSKQQRKTLMISILSLSLLTVMAGAAVAPALGVIKEAFPNASQLSIQLIISMPALFIFLTNMIFPRLSAKFGSKTLVLAGLFLYTVGGVAAGLFSNITLLLCMRALVGIGVGIIMPLSTGLLAYYYPPEAQSKLSGYSSAMNQIGGVVATLLAGVLSAVNWRASFLVYLLGLISVVLCALFLPNDRLGGSRETEEQADETADAKPEKVSVITSIKTYYKYIIAMFLLMSCFFLYPANYAMETLRFDTMVPASLISVIMAFADVVAAVGGFLFFRIMKTAKGMTKIVSPVIFLAGFVCLWLGGWAGTLLGSALVGFANGAGVPFVISQGSMKAGKAAASTVMPLVSAALYLSQFVSPFLMSGATAVLGNFRHPAYLFGMVLSVLFLLWSLTIQVIVPKPLELAAELEEQKASRS